MVTLMSSAHPTDHLRVDERTGLSEPPCRRRVSQSRFGNFTHGEHRPRRCPNDAVGHAAD